MRPVGNLVKGIDTLKIQGGESLSLLHHVLIGAPYYEETWIDYGNHPCGNDIPDDQDFVFTCVESLSSRVSTMVLSAVRIGGDPDLVTAEGDVIHLAVGIVALEGKTSS